MTVNHTILMVKQAEHFEKDTKLIKAITNHSHSNYADHVIYENHLYSKLENYLEILYICQEKTYKSIKIKKKILNYY